MTIYGKLTKNEALRFSYLDAINGWGILNYPESYYPDSVCGCRIPVTLSTGSGEPPAAIPELTASLI